MSAIFMVRCAEDVQFIAVDLGKTQFIAVDLERLSLNSHGLGKESHLIVVGFGCSCSSLDVTESDTLCIIRSVPLHAKASRARASWW